MVRSRHLEFEKVWYVVVLTDRLEELIGVLRQVLTFDV